MLPARKNNPLTAWLVERIGVLVVCAVFFYLRIARARRRAAIRRQLEHRSNPVRSYIIELVAMVRILFLMSMASILRLK